MSSINGSENRLGQQPDFRVGRQKARRANIDITEGDQAIIEGENVVYVLSRDTHSRGAADQSDSFILDESTEEAAARTEKILSRNLPQISSGVSRGEVATKSDLYHTKPEIRLESGEEAIIDHIDRNYPEGTAVAMSKSRFEEIASGATMSDLVEALMSTEHDENDTLIVRSNGE